MTARLIALCSPVMGSGKTTLAQHLVDEHNFYRVPFAKPLKMMTCALLKSTGMPETKVDEYVFGRRKEEVIPGIGVSSRRIQQTLGTEWGRQTIRDSFWIDITMSTIRGIMEAGISVVVDDMRFPNEHAAVLHAGGDCYRVCRPDAAMTTSAHASEGQLDGIHMREIWNVGTVDELHAAAVRAFHLR